ncbi:MAG TPA: aldo/keto reductase, partial [Flavisolibacter sp.]|nr:aldo/keto reductase [Flavisolibacter sp.]
GKLRRGQAMPENTRLKGIPGTGPEVPEEYLYKVVDAIDEIAKETGKTITQVALNWLLQRPTISSIIIGARNEEQLKQNLGAIGWNLTPEQIEKLDAASAQRPVYPYWHQRQNLKLNPIPTT